MKFNNQQIYQLANDLISSFDNSDIYIPAKANFFIQKNIAILSAAAQEIEKQRFEIAKHYGQSNEDNETYTISPENKEKAFEEMKDLFSIEQDLDIKTFSIEDLGDTQFTSTQMQVIMFMIED